MTPSYSLTIRAYLLALGQAMMLRAPSPVQLGLSVLGNSKLSFKLRRKKGRKERKKRRRQGQWGD